jgi:carbon storage regulator CsrA
MLVLSRRKHQEIFIGDEIVISVTSILANVVQIGIEAPKGIPVRRGELGARASSGHDWTWACVQICQSETVRRTCNPDRLLRRGKNGVLVESFMIDGERITRECRMNANDCGACDWEIADVY